MTVLKARNLSRGEVHRLLGFQPLYNGSFVPLLELEPLTEFEQIELAKIQTEFRTYLSEDRVSEGQIRFLSVAPLLRLAGYNESPIHLNIEEDIDRIYIEDEDTHITGRFDIVAVNKIDRIPLWILVVESKNSEASEVAGIAQMLAYAYQSLERQTSVWGLVTNGATYQFFYLLKQEELTYQYMPSLDLFQDDRAIQLLQVLKAIAKS
ncbi:restriction endonuclease subunit R [Pseudanabaenaceae cyanobacterium LEGE 13415]|nr:restriction endonuclease subunit R [Pseudanabaenaceae cyanobacterium LEGE 13415]